MLPLRTALLISVALGVALEVGTLPSRGGLVIAVILSLAIGYFASGRAWLAPMAIGPAEFAAALYRGGSMASNWIGPFFYFLALSVPMVLAAYLGHRFRSRQRASR